MQEQTKKWWSMQLLFSYFKTIFQKAYISGNCTTSPKLQAHGRARAKRGEEVQWRCRSPLAPLLPHRGIDLQLISPVASRGPWDTVLSPLLIRNHDCPCRTGEVQKVHKGLFQDTKSALGHPHLKLACLSFARFSIFLECWVSAVNVVTSSFFPVQKEWSLLLKVRYVMMSEDARYHGGIAPKAAWLCLFTPYEGLSTGINSWPNLIGISHPTGA